jgi:hypothetical protein
MSAFDDEILAVATETLNEFGKLVTIGVVAAGTYDPDTASSAPASAPRAVKGVLEPVKGLELLGGLVEAGDMLLTVAASGFDAAPTTENTATIDTVTYIIYQVKTIYAQNNPVLYQMYIRK